MRKNCYLLLCMLFVCMVSYAQDGYRTAKDIAYVGENETDAYRLERCKLDVYYPTDKKDFSTVVWFHGGGLEGGGKYLPQEFVKQGFAVVSVNYRLSPRAKNPSYIEDAAEAVAWVFRHISEYGGNPERIFVSGHSAGGYLTLILAMDKSYLQQHDIDANRVAAYLPLSGQTVTHFTIRKERGLPDIIPIIDKYAPVNNARPDTPPIVLITGDRRLEMNARYEENALLEAVLHGVGNKQVTLYELQGFDHGQMAAPGCIYVAEYIKRFK